MGEVRFRVVAAEPHPCAYRPGQTARLPLRLASGRVTPELCDRLFAEGDRRAGVFLYRPSCPACRA